MVNLTEYLYKKIQPIIESWNEEGIYALSFFVYTNEASDNIPIFVISYNTEEDCEYSSQLSEQRWNYAYWRQDENEIIGDEESTNILLQWFKENGIKEIGYEDETLMYDEDYNYIGKGPNGYYELLQIVSNVAKRLHDNKVIINTFKREIPIIIHDLEYSWFSEEATKNGNPNGKAEKFLEVLLQEFPD
ncbi:hypothetical protein ACQKM9_20265 [Viridibacillus sp. NPDC093762]|uniref:hypothetical protein n=1 Tax=Viridibacillus sp. NPDC093762 TaxID=3390720 RepID=UPI003CFE7223